MNYVCFCSVEQMISELAKICTRCHKRLDEASRAIVNVKDLEQLQIVAQKNLNDLRLVSREIQQDNGPPAASTTTEATLARPAAQRLNEYVVEVDGQSWKPVLA